MILFQGTSSDGCIFFHILFFISPDFKNVPHFKMYHCSFVEKYLVLLHRGYDEPNKLKGKLGQAGHQLKQQAASSPLTPVQAVSDTKQAHKC